MSEVNKAEGIDFKGKGSDYFRIWIVNTFLSIATFGLYSAWAKVRRRNYFYSVSEIAGSSFRYTANPLMILRSRVIVAALLVFHNLSQLVNPLLPMGIVALVLAFLPFLMVSSMRFTAHNSRYRNISFNFKRSYGQAFGCYTNFIFLFLTAALSFLLLSQFGEQLAAQVNNPKLLETIILSGFGGMVLLYILSVPFYSWRTSKWMM